MSSEPRFLFILTPPYSGSTAFAKFLNTSPRSMMLEPNAEGQTLLPTLYKDRWNPHKAVDWPLVKDVWLQKHRAINELVETIRVVIEKSPPHLLRAPELKRHFPQAAFVSFIRDPYAQCASILHRNRPPETLGAAERDAWMLKFAQCWLFRAEYVRRNVESGLLHFSYEHFCAQPARCLAQVLELCPELEQLDAGATVAVKDYPMQPILDQNARQIALLTSRDREIVTEVLSESPTLVGFFGYGLAVV